MVFIFYIFGHFKCPKAEHIGEGVRAIYSWGASDKNPDASTAPEAASEGGTSV